MNPTSSMQTDESLQMKDKDMMNLQPSTSEVQPGQPGMSAAAPTSVPSDLSLLRYEVAGLESGLSTLDDQYTRMQNAQIRSECKHDLLKASYSVLWDKVSACEADYKLLQEQQARVQGNMTLNRLARGRLMTALDKANEDLDFVNREVVKERVEVKSCHANRETWKRRLTDVNKEMALVLEFPDRTIRELARETRRMTGLLSDQQLDENGDPNGGSKQQDVADGHEEGVDLSLNYLTDLSRVSIADMLNFQTWFEEHDRKMKEKHHEEERMSDRVETQERNQNAARTGTFISTPSSKSIIGLSTSEGDVHVQHKSPRLNFGKDRSRSKVIDSNDEAQPLTSALLAEAFENFHTGFQTLAWARQKIQGDSPSGKRRAEEISTATSTTPTDQPVSKRSCPAPASPASPSSHDEGPGPIKGSVRRNTGSRPAQDSHSEYAPEADKPKKKAGGARKSSRVPNKTLEQQIWELTSRRFVPDPP